MGILKNIILIIIVLALAHFGATILGKLYIYFFPQIWGLFSLSKDAGEYFIGFPLTYIFFVPLLYTAFGGAKKYWWIGILLIPAILFELYVDFSHIYFPIALGIVGWLLGLAVLKIFPRLNSQESLR